MKPFSNRTKILRALVFVVAFAVVLLVGAWLYGAYRWTSETQELRARLDAARVPLRPQTVDFRELEGLPAPVRRYFRMVLTDPSWKGVYTLGGTAALITVLVALLDIILSFLPGEKDIQPGKLTATEWFERFQESRFLALRDLGLWNIVNTILALPVHLALYGAHRRTNQEVFAALAAILSFIGAAVYTANNKALPMLALSNRYTAASTDAQRDQIAATGQAMLAEGEDFTPGSFMGFFLTEVAGIVTGITMLRSRLFGRLCAWAGIVGSGLLLAFTVWATFVPAAYRRAMVLAMGGGILSMAWQILTARKLLQLGYSDRQANR